MELVEFNCVNLGQLKFFGAHLHFGHDFIIKSNAKSTIFDYLIFFDSRGVSREFNGSLADKVTNKLNAIGKTYLLVCRPLELTIWATLISFLKLNQLKVEKIITNMGFVDFTPKKLSILINASEQVEAAIGPDIVDYYFIEEIVSPAGEIIPLYAMRYTLAYKNAVESLAMTHSMIVINTPPVSPSIPLERSRPNSFFLSQAVSNKFNRKIHGAHVIDFPYFDKALTYDAVHYTPLGNEIIFEKVKDLL
jgi:hypothetical protein